MIREECGLVNQQHIIKNRANVIGHIWSQDNEARVTELFKSVMYIYSHGAAHRGSS